MTDERKAMFEDWKNKNKYKIEGVVITLLSYEKGVDTKTCYDEVDWLIQKAYFDGLKAGSPKWHKVSEQIPTEEKDYLVKLTDGTVDVMTIALDGNLEPYLLSCRLDFYKDVEKWCEIPKE